MPDNPRLSEGSAAENHPSFYEQMNDLQQLYEQAPCGYHSLDENGVFIQINQTELTMLGYSREEIIGNKKFSDLLTPENQQIFAANFPIFKQRGWIGDLEFHPICKNGDILPISLSATAIKDEAGNYVMSRSVVIDISERAWLESERQRLEADRQQTEVELRNSESRYRLLFENSPNPMWIYDPDTLAFLEVNAAAIAHYGYSPAEFLQMTISDIRHPIDIPALEQINLNLIPGQPYTGIWQHLKQDGSPIDVEITAYAVFVASRQVNMVLVKDITELKRLVADQEQSEVALRENEQLLRLALAGAQAGSWDWDLTTGKLIWSTETYHLHGLDPADGLPEYEGWYNSLLHPDDRHWVNDRMIQVVSQRLPDIKIEFRIVHPQLGIRWMVSLGSLTCNDRGEPTRLSGINLDITDRQQAEQKIHEQATLLDIASDAIYVTDLEHRILYWNQGAERLYGWQAAAAIGQTAFDLFQEDPDRILEIRHILLKRGELQGEIHMVSG